MVRPLGKKKTLVRATSGILIAGARGEQEKKRSTGALFTFFFRAR
jgi:hypothetical protein